MPNIQIERLKSLPIQRTDEVWEIAASPLPATAPRQAGGRPEQLVACVCVSSAGGAAMAAPQSVENFDPGAPLQAVTLFALDPLLPDTKPLNYLPSRVHVGPMPEDAQQAIESALTELGISVEIKDDVELAADFFIGLAVHLAGPDSMGPSPLLKAPALNRVKGITVERIAAFADAARQFWHAAPWRHFDGEVVWRIDPAPKSRPFKHCVVMGGGGEEFGLAFISDPLQAIAMHAADDPEDYWMNASGTHWSVMFEPADESPRADTQFWKDHALPLAEHDAFPVPMGVSTTSGRIQRPSPVNLTLMEGLLRVFATLKRADVKSGRFTREVATFDGPVTFTLDAAMKM